MDEEWEITCTKEIFTKVRQDTKFPYIVALARAVNALYAINSLLPLPSETDTPARVRNGMNSYFFASALLYECLVLIRKMKRPFSDDNDFQNGLRMLLKDRTAQIIEQKHLNAARNHVVFHFIPEEFGKAISKGSMKPQVFITSVGVKKRELHYSYADVLAAEILVGVHEGDPAFWDTFEKAAESTKDLVINFTKDAEWLIAIYLKKWGFKRETMPSS